MTIGERIFVKRRESGMSQEDLGNKLDVSRQTVYKWEADQAIPELGKLIALAELFDVKVGWLINGEGDNEEQAQANCDANAPKEEEAYEKATERLIEYMAKRDEKAEPPIRPLAIWFLAAALGVLLFMCIGKISALEKSNRELNLAVINNKYHLEQKINDITSEITAVLNTHNDVTIRSELTIYSFDFEKNTVSFRISATPKTYTDGMQALFHVKMGDEQYTMFNFDGSNLGNSSFGVVAEVPLISDFAEISAEFISGNTRENCVIGYLGDLMYGTFQFCEVPYESDWIRSDYSGFYEEYARIMIGTGLDIVEKSEMGGQKPKVVSVEAFLTEDGERIADYTYDEAFSNKMNESDRVLHMVDSLLYFFKRPSEIELTRGKTYEEHFILTDEYGRWVDVTYAGYSQHPEYHLNANEK